ncbi:MAG: DUF1048 domain-containing protein [Clostridiales bacterium]|nr:DUF1048 domain-containing protein [Clostridiales bacterium]
MSLMEKVWGNVQDKREWKELETRAAKLPENYRKAYKAIQKYMWSSGHCPADWKDSFHILQGMVELLEEGAAEQKSVAELTGGDAAAFCDDMLKEVRTLNDKYRKKLNRTIS